jgi:aspartyl-tRNA(Asn)/glutamyl-tRNA(Gln) amidotransferase subunit C
MTEKDIEKLAELAKIHIPEGKTEGFLKDFESILGYVKQIESVDVGDVEQSFFLKNVLRKDENPNTTGALSEALLASAPETHDGFVKVNKIL